MKIDLEKIKKIHFIGIGGIGVSAIARMMLDLGKEVSGSDSGESRITKDLQNLGAKIQIGHSKEALSEDIDLVIYTIAIPQDNPELEKAKRLDIQRLTYPEMLGLISKNYKTIAIAGTNGKTTTTAMTAEILIKTKINPNVIIGSLLRESGSNYIKGGEEYFLVEACEYRRSFLNLKPHILAITNLEEEHLDYFKDLADIQDAFGDLVSKIDKEGYLACDTSDKNLVPVLKRAKCHIVDYTKFIDNNLELKVPGKHNILNSAIVLAISEILDLEREKTIKSLENYSGVWRRFEFKGKTPAGALVYDDYAHHHTSIETTIDGVKKAYDKKIRILFQPHLYSRTKSFLTEIAKSFSLADEVLVLPIYAAREKADESISSEMLVEKMKEEGVNAEFVSSFDKATERLKDNGKNDLIITMGAGDVYKIGENLLNNSKND